MSDHPPFLSVVITTRNRRAKLGLVLESVLAQEPEEVIVVDDGSDDGSQIFVAELARRHPSVRLVASTRNLGPTRARILGAQQARGEVILSLDDDVIPGPGLVDGHRQYHSGDSGLVLLGYMPPAVASPRRRGGFAVREYAAVYERHCRLYESDPRTILTQFWGGNFSVQRNHFLAAVDGHDLSLRFLEDRELGLWLRSRGLRPVFDRALRATHAYERTFRQYLFDAWRSGEAARLLAERYPEVTGRFASDDLLPTDSPLTRGIVRLTDRPRLQLLAVSALRAAVPALGRVGASETQRKAAALAGHVVRRDGAKHGRLRARL